MAYNIANNLRISTPDPIGVDQLKRKNALADAQMHQEQQRNALYGRQIAQNDARMKADEQAAALERVRQWAPGAIAQVEQDPSLLPQFLATGQRLGIFDPARTPDSVTPRDIAELKVELGITPAAAPVPFEQTPDGLKFNEQRRQFDERMKLDRAKFAADQRAGAAAPGAQPVAAPAKPLPVGALRMVDDAKQAINATGESLTIVDRAIQKIENGEVNLGMASNAKARVRNTLGVSTKESRAFADIKQTLEKLRNNYLLLAKGVQTEGDAQRAWNSEIGESVQNDNKLAAQQLGKAKMLLQRAIQAQNDRISGVYANYGASPPAAPAAADGWSIVEVK